jgi:hypothetical protein
LKEEGGIANFTEDNPNGIADPDDLHEIQASDDLNEPDPEENLPPTGAIAGILKRMIQSSVSPVAVSRVTYSPIFIPDTAVMACQQALVHS